MKKIIEKEFDIFENLVERNDVINCDPEDIIYMDWLKDWNKELFGENRD